MKSRKLRNLMTTAALLTTVAARAEAGIGFKLPPQTTSTCGPARCNPSFPIIDQSVKLDGSLATFEARYGHSISRGSTDITTGPTRHSSDVQGDLILVCEKNPGFFAAHGLGSVSGTACVPSREEIYDGYFTQYPANAPEAILFAEYVRLRREELRLAPERESPRAARRKPHANCGDGKLDFGETCAVCPQDHVSSPCPATAPPRGFAPAMKSTAELRIVLSRERPAR